MAENTDKKKTRRVKYLVDRKFQSKMIVATVMLVIGAVLLSGILSYSMALHIEKNDSRKIYGSRLEAQDDIVLLERLMIVRPIILRYLLLGSVFSVILTLVFMVFYSHRLAGPVYHLEKHLDDMIAGNFSKELKFRKNDEFKQLADLINRLQNRLKDLEEA